MTREISPQPAPSRESRYGDWIQTYSLRQFWPLDPRPEDVALEDIAHALALMCRFTGHVHHFYSVAEHSVRVSNHAADLAATRHDLAPTVRAEYITLCARWGLLHDASEAYLVDVARPVKRLPEMAPYRLAETRIQNVVCERFGLPLQEPAEVKTADRVLCYTEARDLFPSVHPAWRWDAEPLHQRILPWDPKTAEAAFLTHFRRLFEVRP